MYQKKKKNRNMSILLPETESLKSRFKHEKFSCTLHVSHLSVTIFATQFSIHLSSINNRKSLCNKREEPIITLSIFGNFIIPFSNENVIIILLPISFRKLNLFLIELISTQKSYSTLSRCTVVATILFIVLAY